MAARKRTSKKQVEVNPEDVLNFLKNQGTAPKELLQNDDPVVDPTSFFHSKALLKKSDLSEEELNKLNNKVEEVEDTKSDTPKPTEFDPETPTVQESIEMSTALPTLGKIVLTDFEKDLYIKTLLNDVPYELSIEPFKGVSMHVKSRTLRTENLVFHILSKERASGEIIGPETYFTRLQQLLATVQITKIGDTVVELDPSVLKLLPDHAHEHLRKHIDQFYMDITSQKWNAITFAIRIFETKLKLCNDNLRDENFWPTEDIS